jgi:hypothetical protein
LILLTTMYRKSLTEILSTLPLLLKDASRAWWILEHQRGHITCQQWTAALTKQSTTDAWSRHMDAQLHKHCFPASHVQQAPVGRLGLEASDLPITSEGIFLASAKFDDEIDCTPVICFALDALKTSARWTIRENSLHRVAFERKQHLPLLAHADFGSCGAGRLCCRSITPPLQPAVMLRGACVAGNECSGDNAGRVIIPPLIGRSVGSCPTVRQSPHCPLQAAPNE